MGNGPDGFQSILDDRLPSIEARLGTGAIGVDVFDYLSRANWTYNADRWFHAASLIKLAVLVGLVDAVVQGRFTLDCRLHVRNRFLSVAGGAPFRIDPGRDADGEVHAAVGRTMRLYELARHMIVTSSNLATNLLLDLVGVDAIRATLDRMGVHGVDLQRGVEDHRAFAAGISNRMTAKGAVALLRAIVDARTLPREMSVEMLDILHGQQFDGTIAAGLPEALRAVTRVAHKTGEISSVSHDAGIVFLPGRPPYVVAILAESDGDARLRAEVSMEVSTVVYRCIAAAGEGALR